MTAAARASAPPAPTAPTAALVRHHHPREVGVELAQGHGAEPSVPRRRGASRSAGLAPMTDLVVRNAPARRRSGAPARPADVVVDGGRIVEVTDAGDASTGVGRAGCSTPTAGWSRPGWVDVHTHYDAQVTWDPWVTPELVARRHHRGDGQLRRRLRAGGRRPPRVAHRADGGRRGHPRLGHDRGHHVGVDELPGVPRRRRAPARRCSTSAPRSPTARCGPS